MASADELRDHLQQQAALIDKLIQLQTAQITATNAQIQNQAGAGGSQNVTSTAPVTIHQPVVPPPGEFSFQAEHWAEWKARFTRYKRTALDSYTSEQQVDYLVAYLGPKAENIVKSFHLSEDDSKNYGIVLGKLDEYFTQKKNLVYERVKFLQRSQDKDEPCDSFVNDLTTMAQSCEWGTLESEMIKLRIIAGLENSRLSMQLQSHPDDSTAEVIRKVRLAESLHKQQEVVRANVSAVPATMSSHNQLEVNAVRTTTRHNNVRRNQKYNKSSSEKRTPERKDDTFRTEKDCRKCGLSPRHAFANCPAKRDTCRNCGKIGHWATKCMSKQNARNDNQSHVNAVSTLSLQSKQQSSVSDDKDIYFLGSVDSNNSEPWRVNVSFSGVKILCKIDTGADVTVVKSDILQKLKSLNLDVPQKPLLSASGDSLKVIGTFDSHIEWKNKQYFTKIYVAENLHENLLGREVCEGLGMLSWANSISVANQYPQLFDGIGNLGKEYHIKLKNDAESFSISTPRRVPLQLRDEVKKHLENLEQQNIIFKVTEPTAWCAPMVVVPKTNGQVRICVDYTTLNKSVRTERLELPEVVESLAQIDSQSKYFSKLDATSGFYHIPLDKDSQLLTTFITPFGRYAYRRLPMGITSATERFQREMHETLEGLEGIVNVADDTLVFGRNKEEHDTRLQKVLKRFQQKGLRLNKTKCIFGAQKLKFLGHIVSDQGVEIDPEKINAITRMVAPNDVSGVRQLLGCVQVHSRFLPSLADMAKPIHQLLSKNVEYCWNEMHQKAFDEIKKALTSAPILAHFAPGRPTRVAADASSYGLGAVIEQYQTDGNWRPISFASRTMSDTEKRYAQIEREALASTWACEKFSQYLIGQTFLLLTDHMPLVQILGSKPIADLSARLQRFRMRLMRYSYRVEYIPGKNMHIPDMLSRSPLESQGSGTDVLFIDEVEQFVKHTYDSLPINDIQLQKIKASQDNDNQTQKLLTYVEHGWPHPSNLQLEDKVFYQFRNELVSLDGLLVRNNRIYVPPELRKDILEKLHEGHLGISKCRSRAKETVWWPGISNQISQKVTNCLKCVEYRIPPVEPLKPSPIPDYPWQVIAADLFETSGHHYLVVVDYFSRFIEVASLKTETSNEVIEKLKSIMARWGIPEMFRSDNGPCFNSYTFKKFAQDYGFSHTTSSPTFAQSNGQAEAAVKIAKRILQKSRDPNLGLLSYRSAKLECGFSPAELLMGRNIRTTLPSTKPQLIPRWPHIVEFRKKRQREIEKQQENYNKRHRVRSPSPLGLNDKVWITNVKSYGTIVNSGPEPRTYTIVSQNNVYRRNRSQLIKINTAPPITDMDIFDYSSQKIQSPITFTHENVDTPSTSPESEEEEDMGTQSEVSTNVHGHAEYTTRSGRISRPPQKLCYR
jgi:transposase InsO family protein/predicted aspartyl protease